MRVGEGLWSVEWTIKLPLWWRDLCLVYAGNSKEKWFESCVKQGEEMLVFSRITLLTLIKLCRKSRFMLGCGWKIWQTLMSALLLSGNLKLLWVYWSVCAGKVGELDSWCYIGYCLVLVMRRWYWNKWEYDKDLGSATINLKEGIMGIFIWVAYLLLKECSCAICFLWWVNIPMHLW